MCNLTSLYVNRSELMSPSLTSTLKSASLIFCCLALIACGGVSPPTLDDSDAPDWAQQIDNPLCYVGTQKFRGNPAAAYTLSEANARAEFSRALESKVKSWIKSYSAEGGTAEGDFSEENSKIITTIMSKSVQNGARIVKKRSMGKQVYVMLCMQAGELEKAFKQMKTLSKAVRKNLEQRAAEAEADMKRDFEKYDQ